MTINSWVDTVMFRAYLSKFLVPTLGPGDIVFMNNLGAKGGGHSGNNRGGGSNAAVLATVFAGLVADRIMLVQVEDIFACRQGAYAKTLEGTIRATIDTITAADVRSWFMQCGYALQCASNHSNKDEM